MSETRRIRSELSALQERIRSLGNTNRNRWAKFSISNKMSKEEFAQKLRTFDLGIDENDIDEIWSIMEPQGDTISMSNFIKLIQVDAFSYVPSTKVGQEYSPRQISSEIPQERPQEAVYTPNGHDRISSTSTAIFRNLESIIHQCMDLDRRKRAEVSLRSFTSICSDSGVNAYDEEWKEFIHKFDPYATGLIPYYLVADTVCKDNDINEIPAEEELPPLYEPRQEQMPQAQNQERYQREDFYDEQPPLPAMQQDNYEQPQMQERSMDNSYNSAEFQDSRSSSRYGEFEPGQEAPPIDENALRKLIADKVDESMGSSSNAFNRWRGMDSKLTPANLRLGLSKDAHIDVPLLDLEKITSKFGGDLSQSNFSRMLGEGSALTSSRKMTQDDQALQDIADQIHQEGWEKIFFRASSASEITKLLSEMGVIADENDIRRLTMKLGRTGVIDSLKMRVRY